MCTEVQKVLYVKQSYHGNQPLCSASYSHCHSYSNFLTLVLEFQW